MQQGRVLVAALGGTVAALIPVFLMPSGDTFWSAVVWLAVVGAVGGAVFVVLARVLAPRELADARLSLRNLRGGRAQA
jgi:hypothetical protein